MFPDQQDRPLFIVESPSEVFFDGTYLLSLEGKCINDIDSDFNPTFGGDRAELKRIGLYDEKQY